MIEQKEYVLESDRLKDPLNDRVVKSLRRPPVKELTSERVFTEGAAVDPELIKVYLEEQGRLSKECLLELITRTKALLNAEPNLLRIEGKVIIVGDIHGQFFDLIWMLKKTRAKLGDSCKLLFLGDYVDRGLYGIEVMAYLFALKLSNPHGVLLLRGNHETREMTTFYNFRD